jgi:hypothetical protein
VLRTVVILALCARGVVVCGDAPDPGGRTVDVKLTDAGCSPARLSLHAGRLTFRVTNAGTSRVSELELLAGSRVLGSGRTSSPGCPARSRSRSSRATTR